MSQISENFSADKNTDFTKVDIQNILHMLDPRYSIESHAGKLKLPERALFLQTALEDFGPNRSRFGGLSGYEAFSEQQVQDIVNRVYSHVDELNKQAETLGNSTKKTSQPQLTMRQEPDRDFSDNLAWHTLKIQLEVSGATVHEFKSSHRLSSWTRDAYIAGPNSAITLPMNENGDVYGSGAQSQQNNSVTETIKALNGLGVTTTGIAEGTLQGGDILQHPQSNTVFVAVYTDKDGKPFEYQSKSAQAVAKELGMHLQMVPKAQASPFYHLDTFMSVLPDGSVILLPDATTPETVMAIKKAVGDHGEILELPVKSGETQEQANNRRSMVTNIITINGNSFTGKALPEVTTFLNERGLNVFTDENSVWGDSGPHCQVNFLIRNKSDGRSDVASVTLESLPRFTVSTISPDDLGTFTRPVTATALDHQNDRKAPPMLG